MSVVICKEDNKVFSEQDLKSRIYKGLSEANWKRNTEYDWDQDKEVEIENEWIKTTSKGYNSVKVFILDDETDFNKYGYMSFCAHETDEEGDTYISNEFSLKVSSIDCFKLGDEGSIKVIFDIDNISNVINLR